jgi:hypothetical protein
VDRERAYQGARTLVAASEAALDADTVKRHGAVYTPTYITRRLVAQSAALRAELPCPPDVPRICDPACGGGAFLVTAVEFLEHHFGVAPLDAVQNYVRGVDVDPRAVGFARATLRELLRLRGCDPAAAEEAALQSVRTGDSLLTPVTEARRALFGGPAPDIVVTNPPYVKLQTLSLSHRARLEAAFDGLAKGSFSLALLFLLRCRELVGPGVAGLITQNNLFTSLAGKPVRRCLQEGRSVLRIVDFTHRRVFSGVSAYTCLIYVGGDGMRKGLDYAAVHSNDVESGLGRVRFSRVHYSELDAAKWRLGDRRDLDNIARIESSPLRLSELCEIRVGFATLKDRAFFLGDDAVGRGPSGHRTEVEPELARPAWKVADLNTRDDIFEKRRRILFPYRRIHGEWVLIPWDELASAYPKAAAHLLGWREVLTRRDAGKISAARWYGWGRAQGMDAPGPKLLTKTFSRRPDFVLDPTDSLFCNGYSVRPRPGTIAEELGVEGMQRILNGRVMHYYACVTSFHIAGGYQCYQKNFIERFTLPPQIGDLAPALLRANIPEADELLAQAYGIDLADVNRLISAYSVSASSPG